MDRGTWVFVTAAVVVIAGLAWARFLRPPAPVPDAFAGTPTLQAAMTESAEAGKPVLALATADWCPACQVLKRGALTDPELTQSITARTIPVYLDVTDNSDPETTAAAQALGVRSIPALILLRDGKIVSRLEGAYPSGQILEWLNRYTGTDAQTLSSAGG